MTPKCPRCGSTGMYPIPDTNPKSTAPSSGRRWECFDCGKNVFRKRPDPDLPVDHA